jgi:hypothetical protein
VFVLVVQSVSDGLTAKSRALLDRFIFMNARTERAPKPVKDAQWLTLEKAICEWASLRGQTLARTVRGLAQIRDALIEIAFAEYHGTLRGGAHDWSGFEKLVDSKVLPKLTTSSSCF